MEQRKYLVAIVSSSVALSGCQNTDSRQIGLGRIAIDNYREESTGVTVHVEKDGETVYERTHHLDGTTDGSPTGDEITAEWMGDDAHYNVTVSVDETGLHERFSTEDANELVSDWGDNECFTLTVSIEEDAIYFLLGSRESCPE